MAKNMCDKIMESAEVGFKVVEVEQNAYKFYDENWDCAEMILER